MSEYIFTDCFDTLIIRKEHPFQISKRWAQSLVRLYPLLNPDKVYLDRKNLITSINTIKLGIYSIYDILAENYYKDKLIFDKSEFIKSCKLLEIKCEESSSYINPKVYTYLKKQKELGKKIFCVSDFHYSSEDLETFLIDLGVDCISGVFCSASYSETKQEGGLYDVVLRELNVAPQNCTMIGDNKTSDIENANNKGLNTRYFSNSFHKSIIRIKNKLNINSISISSIGKELWKKSDTYEEFTILFYTFCMRLYTEAKSKNIKKIVFLSREGYFLKKCFDLYQQYCIPSLYRINTDYLKCSRRAIHSVQNDKCIPEFFGDISVINYFISIGFTEYEARDFSNKLGIENPDKIIDLKKSKEAKIIWDNLEDVINNRINENKAAFTKYLSSIINVKELMIVDVGWTGRMQQGIEKILNDYSIVGCYLGIYDKLIDSPSIKRHGLIFHKNENENISKFFYIFRSNIQMYEQLLSGPHGSACFYRFDEFGVPFVEEAWDIEEKKLYVDVIEEIQNKMLKIFEKLCTYSFDGVKDDCFANTKFNKQLAKIMLRSCLIQSKKRLTFMKRLIKGFSQNFQQQSNGMKFEASKISERKISVLIHPDRFVRYVSKLALVMDNKRLGGLGRCVMRIYYLYTIIILGLWND